MTNETLRMQMLSGVITEGEYKVKLQENKVAAKKKSINEHMIGGIVGIGAINQIPSRTKAVYEDAFEHFLGQKYDLKENEDDMPEAPSHEETDANQVYEEEANEARISPDNVVAYLENTLGHVWNMGTGKNNIDLQSLAQSIAQDLGLIEDLEEGKEVEEPSLYEGDNDLFTAKRFSKRTDNPRINILSHMGAINDIVMDMLETDLVKGYGPDERDDIYREYMKFANAVKTLVK